MKTRTVIATVVVWVLGFASVAMSPATETAWAGSQKDEKACNEVKTRIRTIQNRMRSGYTASQGIRLDEKLRRLKEKRRRVCR
jgi:hypothetical protein